VSRVAYGGLKTSYFHSVHVKKLIKCKSLRSLRIRKRLRKTRPTYIYPFPVAGIGCSCRSMCHWSWRRCCCCCCCWSCCPGPWCFAWGLGEVTGRGEESRRPRPSHELRNTSTAAACGLGPRASHAILTTLSDAFSASRLR